MVSEQEGNSIQNSYHDVVCCVFGIKTKLKTGSEDFR